MAIPRFMGFTAFTPTIPALYWDVYSEEQRMKAICEQLCKLIHYADMLGIEVSEMQRILNDIVAGKFDEMIEAAIERWFEENEPELKANVDKLMADEEKLAFAAFDFENAEAYLRKPITYDGHRYGAQGFAAFKNGSHVVSCVYMTYSDSEDGFLKSFFDDTEVSSLTVNMGHGAHMDYYDGYIYMPNGLNLYRWSIANTGELGSRELVCTMENGGALSIDSDNGQAYILNMLKVYELDLGSGATTEIISNPHWNIPVNVNGQSGFTFKLLGKRYFAWLCSFPNMIYVIDEQGNFVGNKDLPNFADYIRLGESQNMHVLSDGTFFCNFNEGQMPTYVEKTFICITGNIFDMSASEYTSCSPQQYAVIYYDPEDTTHQIPHKNGPGEWAGNNPIICNYGQDVQSIITSTGCNNCVIHVMSSTETNKGLYLTDFNGIVNMDSFVIPKLQLDTCMANVVNAQAMLESQARAVEIRLGSIVTFADVFAGTGLTGANAGLRVNQATAILKPTQDLNYVFKEGSTAEVKAKSTIVIAAS